MILIYLYICSFIHLYRYKLDYLGICQFCGDFFHAKSLKIAIIAKYVAGILDHNLINRTYYKEAFSETFMHVHRRINRNICIQKA